MGLWLWLLWVGVAGWEGFVVEGEGSCAALAVDGCWPRRGGVDFCHGAAVGWEGVVEDVEVWNFEDGGRAFLFLSVGLCRALS